MSAAHPLLPSPYGRPKRPVVALLNFGGPRRAEEVEPFLYEILRDPNTLQLPFPQALQNRLAARIARKRCTEIGRQYEVIGGSSPIVTATEAIGNALAQALERAGQALPLVTAHRYLPGSAAQAVQRILELEADAVLALPLYPHFSYSSTGSSVEQLHTLLRRAGWAGELRAMRHYPVAPGYLDALAARLDATLHEITAASGATPGDSVVLCSAHGLPRAYVEQGDPYRLDLYATLEALRARFPHWRIELSFQSRVGPAEWLRPYTDEIIPRYGAEGVRHLIFLPIAFVNDHIETLYEVGHTYFDLARKHGLTPHRVPAVEDHPGHIAVLTEVALAFAHGRGGVPAQELLPPDQHFRRVGRWVWGSWLAALVAALLYAVGS